MRRRTFLLAAMAACGCTPDPTATSSPDGGGASPSEKTYAEEPCPAVQLARPCAGDDCPVVAATELTCIAGLDYVLAAGGEGNVHVAHRRHFGSPADDFFSRRALVSLQSDGTARAYRLLDHLSALVSDAAGRPFVIGYDVMSSTAASGPPLEVVFPGDAAAPWRREHIATEPWNAAGAMTPDGALYVAYGAMLATRMPSGEWTTRANTSPAPPFRVYVDPVDGSPRIVSSTCYTPSTECTLFEEAHGAVREVGTLEGLYSYKFESLVPAAAGGYALVDAAAAGGKLRIHWFRDGKGEPLIEEQLQLVDEDTGAGVPHASVACSPGTRYQKRTDIVATHGLATTADGATWLFYVVNHYDYDYELIGYKPRSDRNPPSCEGMVVEHRTTASLTVARVGFLPEAAITARWTVDLGPGAKDVALRTATRDKKLILLLAGVGNGPPDGLIIWRTPSAEGPTASQVYEIDTTKITSL